jgi:ribosomal protein S18 acetylase RimI-like enzyme
MRRAEWNDVVAILQLLADDDLGKLHETGDAADCRDAFEAMDRDANQLQAVAELDGTIAGCLQLTFIPGLSRNGMWRAQIEGVRVARLRGQGIGRKMLRWAIARCGERGFGLVQLFVDKSRSDAPRFYEELGFKPSHQGFRLYL